MTAPHGRSPGPLQAVDALRRAMATRDYATAARLTELPATLAGLDALADRAASLRRGQERDTRAVVAVLAAAIADAERHSRWSRTRQKWVTRP